MQKSRYDKKRLTSANIIDYLKEQYGSNAIIKSKDYYKIPNIKALLQNNVKVMNKYMNDVALNTFSYFDTGNTLKCDGIPVIFCLKRTWPFSFINTTNKVNVNTVNGSSEMELTKALITFDDKKISIVVYVALLDQDESFNGCECLLNAYLG